jgi:hypothetical protein
MELSEIVAAALAEDVGTGLVEENPGARCRGTFSARAVQALRAVGYDV